MDAIELRRRVSLGPLQITTHDGETFVVYDQNEILVADDGFSILVKDDLGMHQRRYLPMSKLFTVVPIMPEDEAVELFETEKHAMRRGE